MTTGYDLSGRVAVVTGAGAAGDGIGNGRAAAVLLAEAGALVVGVDLAADVLEHTERLVRERGGTFVGVVADVTDEDDCRRVVARAVEAGGTVDVLVNNVGVMGPKGSVVDVDLEAWERCLRINVTSMVLMSRHVVPLMQAQGSGSIVNLSSVVGLRGGAPSFAYATTKGAVHSLTMSMAATHGPEGIRVNSVAPGFVHTPMVSSRGLTPEQRVHRNSSTPLRTEGTGWDVGHAVLHLASDASRWVSGSTVTVDGGLNAILAMPSVLNGASSPSTAP
jgi:NAD(P)-dependent dehydrogenase (short-subunit alcohol dehydrogenase family)